MCPLRLAWQLVAAATAVLGRLAAPADLPLLTSSEA